MGCNRPAAHRHHRTQRRDSADSRRGLAEGFHISSSAFGGRGGGDHGATSNRHASGAEHQTCRVVQKDDHPGGNRIAFESEPSETGRAYGHPHILQRHPRRIRRARSARDRRVQAGRGESRRISVGSTSSKASTVSQRQSTLAIMQLASWRGTCSPTTRRRRGPASTATLPGRDDSRSILDRAASPTSLEQERSSRHPRKAPRRPITLHHAFFAFQPQQP